VSVLSFDGVSDIEAVDTTDRRGRHLRSACSFLIGSALRNDKATVWRTDMTELTPEKLHEPIDSELVRSDLIIATSAVGIAAVRNELAQLGMVDCCHVAMEPGGDQVFALIGERKVPTFLLPADPVDAFFSYHMFVRPVLRKLMGMLPHRPQSKLCFAADDMVSRTGVFELYPAKLRQSGGRSIAKQCGKRGLITLADLARANAIVALPEDKDVIRAGEPIQVWEF
jgi:molybdopterin molybdotransferase